MLALPFWLWAIWVLCFAWWTVTNGARGFSSTLIGFTIYLILRHFTPGLGPWEQWGLFVLIGFMFGLQVAISYKRLEKY